LKGLYYEELKEVPPKTHNLIALLEDIRISPPEEKKKCIVKINTASIVTRYPEELSEIKKQYSREVVEKILNETNEVLKWIKAQC